MMSIKLKARKVLAESIIHKMKARGIEGFYADTKEDALEIAKSLLKPGMSVTFGGSATLKEVGLLDYLPESGMEVIDRYAAKTPEEIKEMKAKSINADYFLMSSNAITQDGMLVNIDGYANRVSFLCYGPEYVLVIAGMNKIAPDIDSAISRVRNMASPPNAMRLKKDTPCAKTGQCGDCLSKDCICCQVVVTRKSNINNRIKVILVGEDLGF